MSKRNKRGTRGRRPKTEQHRKRLAEEIGRIVKRDDNIWKVTDGNREIDVLEEIAAATLVLDDRDVNRAKALLIGSLDVEGMEKIAKSFVNDDHFKLRILESVNNTDGFELRLMAYCGFRDKNDMTGYIIAMTMAKVVQALVGDTHLKLDYGVDSCILATFVYWAQQKGIMEEAYRYLRPEYRTRIKDRVDKDYKGILMELNKQFGEIYYDMKVGKVPLNEFKESLASENGKLPELRFAEPATSPEFSWLVVDDITGGDRLQNMDYSDEVKESISHIFQCYYHAMHYHTLGLFKHLIYGYYYEMTKEEIRNAFRQVEASRGKIREYEGKLRQFRSSNKRLNVELNRLRQSKIQLSELNKQLENRIRKLEQLGVKDIEPYESKIEDQGEEIERLQEVVRELERSNGKKDKEIEEMKEAQRGLREELRESKECNDRLKETLLNGSDRLYEDEIPTDCLVKSLKDKKIVVFGGDTIHSNIKNLGFKNLKLVEAGDRSTNTSDVINADVLVIITSYVSHASISVPKNTAETHGVPIMYFNNKNVNMLCRELFTFLNSER